MLGNLMSSAHWLVKGVCFDGAHAHGFMRQALQGSFTTLKESDLKDIAFFQDVTYQPLPDNCLPRLPMRLCFHRGESIWPLGGACAWTTLANKICGTMWYPYFTLSVEALHFFGTIMCTSVIIFRSALLLVASLLAASGHAVKNVGGQINSCLRTIHCGKFWCDTSGARALGMPPAAWTRLEAQSDRLHAIMFNPFFALQNLASWLR